MPARSPQFHAQDQCLQLLHAEQRRVERSHRRFVLLLAQPGASLTSQARSDFFRRITSRMSEQIRQTDVLGWVEHEKVIGVIFTEIQSEDVGAIVAGLQERFTRQLSKPGLPAPVTLQWHVFPDDWNKPMADRGPTVIHHLHPAGRDTFYNPAKWVKRALDVSCSVLALALSAPVLGAIALAIKLTSPGPVLFRQQRVGQYGREFTFFKFRSMAASTSASIHEEYVSAFISGVKSGAEGRAAAPSSVYKLTADPRVTPLGRFLRRTSLDELPQFYNVLRGDMSLVGPRPPIPYEVSRYQLWHRRRFLSVKPGLTGLWQITGRSRTTFDEMVRLDLRYSTRWSIWMDLGILVRTPYAVLRGDGAC